MGNKRFFDEAARDNSSISWTDIFDESFRHHSIKDIEYAFAAGSAFDQANRSNMLQKWHKPWLWLRVLALFGVAGLIFYLKVSFFGGDTGQWGAMLCWVLATPLSVMIFMWEMNIPRNISILRLFVYFCIGGAMSLLFNSIFSEMTGEVGQLGAFMAPLSEEPAKLAAAMIILILFARSNREIYGFTGLVIGSGVGTGFTVFESYKYVFNHFATKGYSNALYVLRIRSIPMLNIHLMYSAPYVAMIALEYRKTRNWQKSLLSEKSILVFASSALLHGLWNSSYNSNYLMSCIFAVASFGIMLKVIRDCLKQVVEAAGPAADMTVGVDGYLDGKSASLTLVSQGQVLPGAAWKIKDSATIGRSDQCSVRFPSNTRALSGMHCRIDHMGNGWYITDIGSTYGTYLDGHKLEPGQEYPLRDKSSVRLGSDYARLTIYMR